MISTLVFDITQFFPSLNHQLLSLIFDKVGFDPKVAFFFCNYLVGKKTQYFWNNFSSPLFNVDVGVGQRSAFFPILSALYLALILHILEKQLKNLKISVFIFFFVNNGLLVAQNKLLTVSNSFLFCSYHITSSLVKKFRLIIEHRKMEVFHFSRLHEVFKPSPLDFSPLGSPILQPRNMWYYLGFIFDMKLSFC